MPKSAAMTMAPAAAVIVVFVVASKWFRNRKRLKLNECTDQIRGVKYLQIWNGVNSLPPSAVLH